MQRSNGVGRDGACKVCPTVLELELLNAEIHNAVIKVLAAQVCVASCGLHFKHAVLDGQGGPIESTTSHAIDEHILFTTPYAIAAAMGSVMMRNTFKPQICPALWWPGAGNREVCWNGGNSIRTSVPR